MTGRSARRTAMSGLLSAAIALGLSAPTAADVRVQADHAAESADLDVRLTPRGPWTLLDANDVTVLNPHGDSHGDGLPGSAPRGPRLLASWLRPTGQHAGSEVRVARWDGDSWSEDQQPLDDPAAIGQPLVGSVGDGWGVTWQRAVPRPWIVARGHGESEGAGTATPLLEGWLVDSRFENNVQWVLFETPTRQELRLAAIIWSVPGVPSPVDVIFVGSAGALRQLGIRDDADPGERLGEWRRSGSSLTTFGGGTASIEPSPWTETVLVTGLDPNGEPVAVEIALSDGTALPVPPSDVRPTPQLDRAR